MQTREQKIEKLTQLVNKFTKYIDDYKKPTYNEASLRMDFLDSFFELLDWDIRNEENSHINYKDVLVEERINIYGSDNKKAPDYTFRIGGAKKFFVEAKKPSVDIKDAFEPAFQLKRYGHSAGLCLSILTDFEELSIYDTRKKPNKNDKPTKDRILYYKYTDYIEKFDEIYNLFSKSAIKQGSFEQFEKDDKHRKGNESIDEGILDLVSDFREQLAKNIVKNNEDIDVPTLNKAVIKIIDRLFFLRIAEDKEVEPYKTLFNITNQPDIYDNLKKIFKEAKTRYNSELFEYFKNIDELVIDDKILKEIITNLYTPECVYEFSQIPVSILGSMYEQFLGKTIRITDGGHVKIEEKPEVKKAGGVYYTPEYIVNYIVKNTVGEKVKDLTPKEIEKIKILDPACGSGSFLIGAYQYLIDYHINYYTQEKQIEKSLKNQLIAKTKDGYILSIPEKQKILLNNIFGVDIDQQAVEVAKFSLLLKLMESEDKDTQIKELFKEGQMYLAVLPNLKNNIKCGNSLIGTDYYKTINMELLGKDDDNKINAFDWDKEFPEIFKSGGFDCVIGNPPYIDNRGFNKLQLDYFYSKYKSFSKAGTGKFNTRKFNTFIGFFEIIYNLLKNDGINAYIVHKNILKTTTYTGIRKFILNNFDILKIIDWGSGQFKNVIAETTSLVLEKNNKRNEKILIETFNLNIKQKENFVNQENFLKSFDNIFNINLNDSDIKIIYKIENMTQKLKEFVNINNGIVTGSDSLFLSSTKNNNNFKLCITGKNIKRYSIVGNKGYINYLPEKLLRARKQELFETKEKLIMQMISSNLVVAFDNEQFYNLGTTYLITLNNSYGANIKYILALLNSKLLNYYYKKKFTNESKFTNAVSTKNLFEIPIKFNKNTQDQLINFVNQMLEIQKQLHSAKTESDKQFYQKKADIIDKQIDALVYELYGLTTEEIKIIEG